MKHVDQMGCHQLYLKKWAKELASSLVILPNLSLEEYKFSNFVHNKSDMDHVSNYRTVIYHQQHDLL